MAVSIKRIYEPYAADDGYRVLVDRLWPRGIRKEDPRIDLWLKEVAPSTELRQWFNHDTAKWEEFRLRYHKELHGADAYQELISLMHKHKKLVLLYGAKDEHYNQAVVLKQMLDKA